MALANMLIEMLDGDDDPRAPRVQAVLRAQRDGIAARMTGTPGAGEQAWRDKPPATVVQLEPLTMAVRSSDS